LPHFRPGRYAQHIKRASTRAFPTERSNKKRPDLSGRSEGYFRFFPPFAFFFAAFFFFGILFLF
jgi:hypothetical protein